MDLPEELELLDSNKPEIAEEAKKRFHEWFNRTKDAWLLNGMVDYFVSSGSLRCADVLARVREPHDNHFFNKICDSLRNSQSTRLSILTLLSNVVIRQPTWLYRIAQHNLFRELLKILKTETDVITLMSALLTLIILLPMIPAYVGNTLPDIFEVFSRLAAWNTNNPSKVHSDQLVHLQISLHFLFHRLYGMYPCNFLSFLRQQYGIREQLGVFSHTIKPMIETVKMHPLLVTASKESETTTTRWKTLEYHDVVVECSKLNIDACDDRTAPAVATFRQRSESEIRRLLENSGYHELKSVHNQNMDLTDLWSPVSDNKPTTPPVVTSKSSASASIPVTPIPQSYVISSTFASQIGTSPPEAAVEATPETTPVKDPRSYASKPASINASVVRALNNLGTAKWSPSSPTPSTSQPTSPMKKENSPFRYPETESKSLQRKMQAMIQDRRNAQVEREQAESAKVGLEEPHDVEDDQEVLEINQQGELICTGMGPGRQCDSILQEFHPPHNEDLEVCDLESGSPCPSGGLHMPDIRSRESFRNNVHRLRYYSGADYQLRQSICSSESYEKECELPMYVRRAQSCPDIKKERPSFSGMESSDENLEEQLEQEPLMKSMWTQTQTPEPTPQYPYEYLFLALVPPAPPPPTPLGDSSVHRSSPTTILDQYLDLSARRWAKTDPYTKRNLSVIESELKTARDQLSLLHLQLLFERHRRDSHEKRNRGLMGKSRNNRILEEHNSALKEQLTLLVKDIESLRSELEVNKDAHRRKEKKAEEDISYWQEKCTNLERENRELKSENQRLVIDLKEKKKEVSILSRKLQHVEGKLFTLGTELKEMSAQASASERLRIQVAELKRDLVTLGEQSARAHAHLARLSIRSNKDKQYTYDNYLEQVKSMTIQLDAKTTLCETLRAKVIDLEATVSRKESLMAEQKRLLKATKEECREQLEAVETKYKSQIAINKKLECHILQLTSKLDTMGRRGYRTISSAQDALSFAEKGGMSSPLSASLSSSEGLSLSSTLTTEPVPPRDLQAVLDAPDSSAIPEIPEFDDIPGPSGFRD